MSALNKQYIVFRGTTFVLQDDGNFIPLSELEQRRIRLMEQSQDEVEQLFLANCTTEELLAYVE